MTIKKKLFSLVFGELLMFLIVIGVTVVFVLPILKINNEFSQLTVLKERVLAVEVQVNLLISSPLEIQWKKAQVEKEKLEQQFEILSEQEALSRINNKVAQSLKAVLLLEELFNERWKILSELTPMVMDDMARVMYSSSVPILKLYRVENMNRLDDFTEIMERIAYFEQVIDIVDGALNSAYDVVATQDEAIQREISRKVKDLIIRTLIIFVAAILVIVLLSIRIASGMAGSIVLLEKGVSRLRKGRLTADFNTSAKDEIGKLGENLNGFTEGLSSSILKIKASSENTQHMKDELIGAVGDSKTSSLGISDAVTSIREGMVDLDSRVAESGTAVTTVKDRTEELSGMLEEQMAMIEESTSSVTEMIASIGNVSEITGKKKTATDELVKTAGTGGERLDETIRIIQEITANIDEIRGTASIIQSVAAQTSLLAMNAAIEAAHAGEYGAGFSVVAEEIRKLADASGTSSKRISGVIKEVVGSIEKAAESGDYTRRAFADINTDVVDVAGALDEISSSMDELSAGGRQILDAMISLRGYASGVKDGGNAMNDASGSLEEAFRIVERVTSSVLSQIGGIGTRIEEISGAVEVVAEISSRLSSESELLEAEVSQYDLGDDEEPPEGSVL